MKSKKLLDLYQKTARGTKHSYYQILPNRVKKIVDTENLEINSRYEAERWEYINNKINLKDKKVLDVGCNTGYFTFQAFEFGASQVTAIEGNKNYADFVKFAGKLLNENLIVINKYLDFKDDQLLDSYDVTFLLNIIHHLGDDFGNKNISLDEAKKKMGECINYFHGKSEYLVLQMGFCWKGDRRFLIFENGTKSEMINFIKDHTFNKWEIVNVGIAEEIRGKTKYNEINESNIERFDNLGEFRNRPIVILKSI